MSDIKLLPCPFCGGEARRVNHSRCFDGTMLNSINCQSCGSNTCDTDDESANKWNTRYTSQPLNAKTVARSVWIHIQCAACEKWFPLEDSEDRFAYCPHCRALLNIEETDDNEIQDTH